MGVARVMGLRDRVRLALDRVARELEPHLAESHPELLGPRVADHLSAISSVHTFLGLVGPTGVAPARWTELRVRMLTLALQGLFLELHGAPGARRAAAEWAVRALEGLEVVKREAQDAPG